MKKLNLKTLAMAIIALSSMSVQATDYPTPTPTPAPTATATGTGTASIGTIAPVQNQTLTANPTATGTATVGNIAPVLTANPTATSSLVGGNQTLTGGNLTGGNSSATGTATIGTIAPITTSNGGTATSGSTSGVKIGDVTGGTVNGTVSGQNSLNIEKGAITGGNAVVEKGAVQNTVGANANSALNMSNSGNSTAKVEGSGNSQAASEVSNVGNIEAGAVQVKFEAPKPVRALATTPNAMGVNPQAPTSMYAIGAPNAVGGASLVNLYEDRCPTQMSGNENLVRSETEHEKLIATLDDQARSGNNGTTPRVTIVKAQQVAKVNGQCVCLGTLQVEAQIDPDMAREGNMGTIHAAAGKWIRDNIRGFSSVKLVYAPVSVTFQKGTAAHASSKGIGAGISSIFGGADKAVAMMTPSWGSSNGYSTDYPIVGITYAIVGSIDGEPSADARLLDVGEFMASLAALPRPEAWGVIPPTVRATQQ